MTMLSDNNYYWFIVSVHMSSYGCTWEFPCTQEASVTVGLACVAGGIVSAREIKFWTSK